MEPENKTKNNLASHTVFVNSTDQFNLIKFSDTQCLPNRHGDGRIYEIGVPKIPYQIRKAKFQISGSVIQIVGFFKALETHSPFIAHFTELGLDVKSISAWMINGSCKSAQAGI